MVTTPPKPNKNGISDVAHHNSLQRRLFVWVIVAVVATSITPSLTIGNAQEATSDIPDIDNVDEEAATSLATTINFQETTDDIANNDTDSIEEEMATTSTTINETDEDDMFHQHHLSDLDIFHKKNEEPLGDDTVADGIFEPMLPDFDSCSTAKGEDDMNDPDCWHPPDSTLETDDIEVDVVIEEEEEGTTTSIDATAAYGGDDPDAETQPEKEKPKKARIQRKKVTVDKHWGSNASILRMRDALRTSLPGTKNKRPPIFLMPGLASTRLVAWAHKECKNPLISDVKVQEYVWLNMAKLIEMATIDPLCYTNCLKLGLNQTDDVIGEGCKLRADEGLNAISSLAPGSLSSNLLVGGTNTVYAWLTQWLADNLGYDVSSIVGLPYDWRLSPDVLERRDGFLTSTRKRIEAAVVSNGEPGIMVAHSMGNSIFRYFLEWLRDQMHKEAYERYKKNIERKANSNEKDDVMPGWMGGLPHSSDVDKLSQIIEKMQEGGGRIHDIWNSLRRGGSSTAVAVSNSTAAPAAAPAADHDETSRETSTDEEETQSLPMSSDNEEKSKHENPPFDIMEHLFSPKERTAAEHEQALWKLAVMEGDEAWLEWIHAHIWTYIGLSAPLLGAINPLRAVLSGENMGLPISDALARTMELTFGSTHTVNPISTKMGFCDNNFNMVASIYSNGKITVQDEAKFDRANLACLDELVQDIEKNSTTKDPWHDFHTLRLILKERADWDDDLPNIAVSREKCQKSEKAPCAARTTVKFGPLDVQNGNLFTKFSEIWKEEGDPLTVKRDQLEHSWWNTPFTKNFLTSTWDRPHIKHVIMAYGVDVPTEIGYLFRKEEPIQPNATSTTTEDDPNTDNYDGVPSLHTTVWEEAGGKLTQATFPPNRGITDTVWKKKPKKIPHPPSQGDGKLHHSGDGSVPYLSLSWAHTWLLHATRAMRHSTTPAGERMSDDNALKSIRISHRPRGGSEWIKGGKRVTKRDEAPPEADTDTGTSHPHGTKYKPEMVRFQSKGKSRSTGMEYTTTVIEAIGVEHKETTRNYDILAAVFTDVLKHMHEDFGLV